jgi:hypothetical protein
MTRDEEAAAIAQFLASRGATRCPAAYVAPTTSGLSFEEEARRLKCLRLKAPPTGREYVQTVWRNWAPRAN